MKYFRSAFTKLTLVNVFALSVGLAHAGVKAYQVTGPILEVTDQALTVQKGKEKWEISREASTEGGADLKVGDKVTVYYTMTAKKIEKAGSTDAKGKKGKKG